MCLFLRRYRLQILYLFFGVLTTVVNYASFWMALQVLGHRAAPMANVISFVLATLFAFLTNKRFVFAASDWQWQTVVKEGVAFTTARLLSFGVEEAGLVLGMILLPQRYLMAVKVILSFAAVLLNYVFAKWLVFRKRNAS